MTKEEALKEMKLGKKIKHIHFTDDEWIKSDSRGEIYILEDGVKCPKSEFWKYRTHVSWNYGWDIFE